MEKGQKSDFDEKAIAKATEEHEKNITELNTRLSDLENKLSNPEQLANIIEAASKDSKKLDKTFSSIFCEMIDKDDAVRNAIKKRIDTLDRDALASFIKKWGAFGYTILVLIIGGTITFIFLALAKWLHLA